MPPDERDRPHIAEPENGANEPAGNRVTGPFDYIAAGVAVLPLHSAPEGRCTCGRADCDSAGKHPLTAHGKDDATLDADTVRRWLDRWPHCNWGVRPPHGVVVLDVDPRNGGNITLSMLEAERGKLPATLTARTGSGGRHIWLTYNGPARGRLGIGIDVKTNTGYLVAPPSVHKCGGQYEWIDQRPAAWAPSWVRRLLNPPALRRSVSTSGGGNLAALVRFVADAQEGERNRRLFWAACRAHERGIDPSGLLDAALSVGLTLSAAVATIRSAARTQPRSPERATR